MKKVIFFLLICFSYFMSNSQILTDTIRGVNCNYNGYIHTTIGGIFTNGGTNITNWYYLDTLSGNWDPLVPSSSYIASGQISYNNPNLQGLSSDSLTTSLGGTFKLEIVNSGNIIEDTTWFIRYPLGLKLCCHINIGCHGDSTGSFKAVGHSGKPPYTYFFYDSSFSLISIGSDSIYDNLSSGKYYVSVLDQDSCLVTSPEIIISQPSQPLNVKAEIKHVDCIGNNNGMITLIQSGGKPYNYGYNLLLTNQSNDSVAFINSATTTNNIISLTYDTINILNLYNGTYNLSVSDSNGCLFDSIFSIIEPGPYYPNISQIGDAICSDDSVLIIIDSISGAVGPLQFSWLSNNNDSLYCSPNNYILTVSDSINNCLDTFYYNFQALTNLNILYSTTDVACYGDSTGEISIDSVIGGQSPYNFNINGNSFVNLSSGFYSVSVQDSNNCYLDVNIEIKQNLPIQSNAILYEPSCSGYSDGSISINVSGGSYPYSINWTNGTGNIDSLYGLQKGIYELQVSDSSGCVFNEQLILDEPDSLILTFTNYTNPLICRGELTSIDAIAVGGTPPYFYNWTNNDTTFQSIIGAGTFYCNILDFKGCSISSSIEISEPNPFSIDSYILDEPTCDFGANVSVTLIGGTSPYNYSWSNGETSSSANNIQTSSAWVVVSDYCESTDSIFFNFEQYELETSLYYDNITHYANIEIDFSTTLGPFTYSWNDISSNLISSNDQAGPLCEGTYFVTVTDMSNGCSITDTLIADFFIPNGIIDLSTTTVFSDFDLWGYAPYSYLWDDGSNSQHADLCPGNHWVEVTDVNGCTVREDFVIEDIKLTLSPFDLLIECDISNTDLELEVTAEGGIPPYEILWSDGTSANPISVGLSPGIQGVTITDNNNCSVDTLFRISALTSECIPNVFSPNNDQVNDTWVLEDSYLFSNSIIKVYNRYGKLVFESSGYDNAWDGTNEDGIDLSAGCYFYYIEIGKDTEPIKGTVTIVR